MTEVVAKQRTHRRRSLRAAMSADVANFSGTVSVGETRAFGQLSSILSVGVDELAQHQGTLVSMPGDGFFALFESAIDSVRCALSIQSRIAAKPDIGEMRLRIGIHLGDVLFDGDLPFGETLNIAARLQALARPGEVLISSLVADTVAARISAHFEARGTPQLKNIPRLFSTFAVVPQRSGTHQLDSSKEPLDLTTPVRRSALRADIVPEPPKPLPEIDNRHPAEAAAPSSEPPQPASDHGPLTALSNRQHTPRILEIVAVEFSRYLGPVGPIVVARNSSAFSSIGELLSALEAQIPTPLERESFRLNVARRLSETSF